ncbi:hypothetical protein [Trebonia sp.]|uniref:hypothetical protein n=1 Tax=Trebonia sp. TaxID=2767075 RepID=UPI003BB1124B
MTTHGPAPHAGSGALFDALMAEVMAGASRFGHREHVHLTWLAVRRSGVAAAVGVVSDGIQRTARYALKFRTFDGPGGLAVANGRQVCDLSRHARVRGVLVRDLAG